MPDDVPNERFKIQMPFQKFLKSFVKRGLDEQKVSLTLPVDKDSRTCEELFAYFVSAQEQFYAFFNRMSRWNWGDEIPAEDQFGDFVLAFMEIFIQKTEFSTFYMEWQEKLKKSQAEISRDEYISQFAYDFSWKFCNKVWEKNMIFFDSNAHEDLEPFDDDKHERAQKLKLASDLPADKKPQKLKIKYVQRHPTGVAVDKQATSVIEKVVLEQWFAECSNSFSGTRAKHWHIVLGVHKFWDSDIDSVIFLRAIEFVCIESHTDERLQLKAEIINRCCQDRWQANHIGIDIDLPKSQTQINNIYYADQARCRLILENFFDHKRDQIDLGYVFSL